MRQSSEQDQTRLALPGLPADHPTYPAGFAHHAGFLDAADQARLLTAVLEAVRHVGWFRPTMPRSGRPFSIVMCSLGPLGWVSDRQGYRYQPFHPVCARPWPDIPAAVLEVWNALADWPHPPECCLVNHYCADAKLGMHRDQDETDLTAPVVSISLGDTARFRMGGLRRRDPSLPMTLKSGDVVILAGAARMAFHGIDRVMPGSSALVPGGGRINLTLRRVTPA